eukprot:3506571-Prymnesium_polylepis.1
MSFKSQKDPSVQAALIRNVYSDVKIPVTIMGDDLAKKLTDLAADWVGITDHEKDKPQSFYEALLIKLPAQPETSKLVQFRTWIGTMIANYDTRLNDIDVFLATVVTYITALGFPTGASANSINAVGRDTRAPLEPG